MELIKHVYSKFNCYLISNGLISNLSHTSNFLYRKQWVNINHQFNLVNNLNEDIIYSLRRHRGGKIKNKLRNMDKKKKKEQFLNSTLDKISKVVQNKPE